MLKSLQWIFGLALAAEWIKYSELDRWWAPGEGRILPEVTD